LNPQELALLLLLAMVVSNLAEFYFMRDYGLRARILAVLFVDHLYVMVAWAFGIDRPLFYVYFARANRVVEVGADFLLNVMFIVTELAFVVAPALFPELREVQEEIFRRYRRAQDEGR
jgi:hypothetical protein